MDKYHEKIYKLYYGENYYGIVGDYAGELYDIKLHVGDIIEYRNHHLDRTEQRIIVEDTPKNPDEPKYAIMGWCGHDFESIERIGSIGSDVKVVVGHENITEEYIARNTHVPFKIDKVVRLIDF